MDNEKSTSDLKSILQSTGNIDEFIDSYDEELQIPIFEELIKKLIREKGCSIADVINNGFMSESYCYQLFKGIRRPSRDKAIQLSYGMKLNLEEANKLLRACGKNELYCRNKRDVIIIYGFNNNLSIIDVEEILDSRGLDSLINLE